MFGLTSAQFFWWCDGKESLDKAPQKYPEIVEQVREAAKEAQEKELPAQSSGTLSSCGDFMNSTAPMVQWIAYLNEVPDVVFR